MTNPLTLEAALKLADQDCPLPQLAGAALKVLRTAINGASEELRQIGFNLDRGCDGDMDERVDHALEILNGKQPAGCPACCSDSATLTALIAELRAREALGRLKYGTDVDRTDLTNAQWRQHLREELMDALLYSLAEERTQPLPPLAPEDC